MMMEGDASWRRFSLTFVAGFVAALLLIAATIVFADPYDSGRLLSVLPPGVSDESPRTANVSRGRDRSFDSAIFGNSHSQLIDPARLTASTGLRFVQMTVPGSGPREQDALLRWFLRNHDHVGAVIVGIDELWCRRDASMPLNNPFPFWLYGDTFEFVINHVHTRALVLAERRLRMALGKVKLTDPAGYWDYELGREWAFRNSVDKLPYVDLAPALPQDRNYPVLDVLMNGLALLPENAAAIVVMPPQFREALPAPGSATAAEIAGCKQQLIERLSRRPHSAFVDFYLDTPDNRDPENYMDREHYRSSLARAIEAKIKAAIEQAASGS